MTNAKDVANRAPITAALMLATLMNTLDSTIANVALPHIQGSVSAAQDQVTWVLTSYIIATAVMTPMVGWLASKLGRKRLFLLSIGGFTVTSMLCGVATSLPEIVLFRVAQGLFGAALMPLSQTVMLDLYPMRMIPRVMSLWSAAVILGPIAGPSLGGWLTENLSWRWVFYINLPIGIAAFMVLQMYMADDPGGRQRPFDLVGFSTLTVFVGAFQLMLDRGPSQDWFDATEIWIYAILCGLGLFMFVVQIATAKNPFFPRALFRDANFVGGMVFSLFVGMLLFSTTAILPSFMQTLLGYSALQSGYVSMTRGFGSLISFLLIPSLIPRVGAKPLLVAGVGLCMIALMEMAQFNLAMTSGPIMVSGFIQGLGTGLMFAPLNTLSFATLSPTLRPDGTILATMGRSLGSSVGISLVQSTLVRQGAVDASRLSEHLVAGAPALAGALPRSVPLQSATGLSMLRGIVGRQGAMLAYDYVFAWMALIVLLMLPIIVALRRPPPAAPSPMDGVSE